MDWNNTLLDAPTVGRLVLADFGGDLIECRCEGDGYYTRDDRLIVDCFDCPLEPTGWLPIGESVRAEVAHGL